MPPVQRGQRAQAPVRTLAASLLRRRRRTVSNGRRLPDPLGGVQALPRRGRAAPARLSRMPDLTLAEFVDLYLERHAAGARRRTIGSLRQRLGYATRDYGDVPLRELERMVGRARRLAGARSPTARATASLGALRQTLAAAVPLGLHEREPGEAARPEPRSRRRGTIRAYTLAELDAIAAELSRAVPAAAGVRRRDRAPARGVGGARAARRRPPRRDPERAPHRLRRRGRRARQDEPHPPAGPALAPGARRARRAPAAARHAAAVPGPGGRAARASTTSAAASGARRSRRRASHSPPASTTCARRSPRTPSPPA